MSDFHIPLQAIKGRGVSHQQPHRFARDERAAFDDGWGTAEEAQAAISGLNGMSVGGRSIVVNLSRPKESNAGGGYRDREPRRSY